MKVRGSTQEKKQNNVMMLVFVVLLAVVLAAVIFLAAKKHNADALTGNEVSTETAAAANNPGAEKWQEGTVSYNGKKYCYNTSIKTYLFMGIDKEGTVEPAADGISGGQSDAMFLLAENTKDKTISVIAINRNTMTDVDAYNENGDYIATEKMQICLQHGYGDGMRTSCLRSVDAVSRLFYQLPIDGYLSLNMGAMPILNDAVGGVQVEILQDLEWEERGVSLKKGETVTLSGNEAYVYLRARDVDEFNSATLRLERQMQYLTALFTQIKTRDVAAVMQMYDSVEEYLVTNIEFAGLAEELMECEFDASRMYSVPGEMQEGTLFEEYIVDDTALYEMILEVFYEPVED